MSLDVLRNPTAVPFAGTWYRATETTPFAISGQCGPVLAVLTEDVYGPGPREVWFGDNGWEDSEGRSIDDAHVHWFALMPEAPKP
jgi:hypothetical protein